MVDIFISYASEDLSRVKPLAKALQDQGWSVWWDRNIPPGKFFDQVIEEAINAAKCVVVLWSNKSVNSDWVKTEAAEGKNRKILVPALIDYVQIPLEFKRIQAADLTDWESETSHDRFRSFLSAISEIVVPSLEKNDSERVGDGKQKSIPQIDLELERVKGDPNFAHFEIQFAYDIFLNNKSNVPISYIQVSRLVDPKKNRQKIAIHTKTYEKIRPFHKKINVLAPGARKKIYREHSLSYEFSRFDITYKDDYEKRYLCIFEGDRDGVYLRKNEEIFSSKNE